MTKADFKDVSYIDKLSNFFQKIMVQKNPSKLGFSQTNKNYFLSAGLAAGAAAAGLASFFASSFLAGAA
jgi:hypothetical protein